MKNIAKILCFVLSLALVFSIVGLSTFADEATSSLSGEGTAESPYLINNLADLITFRDEVNAGVNFADKYVKLNADIDLINVDWSVNIGDDANYGFNGHFDGGNHTIKNLKSTETARKADGYVCTGLFGAISGDATIKNLTIENAKISVGEFDGNNIGVVVGFAWSATGSIENVTVCGDVKIDAPKASAVGAILGYDFYGDITVANCAVLANEGSYINGISQVGGIVGYAGTKCEITDCSVENLTIDGKGLVGGIVGVANADGTQLVTVTGASVKNVAITVYGEFWQSSGAVVIGSLGGQTAVITDTTFENVTVNGAAAANLAGSGYVNKPTAPVAPVAASVNGKFYTDLNAAIAAAADGDVVVIANNLDFAIDPSTFTAKHGDDDAAIIIPADKKITIDLNGYTISVVATLAEGATSAHSGAIINNGDLTIDDSSAAGTGKLVFEYVGAYDNGYKRHGAIMNLGSLTVNGGTIENATALENQPAIDNTNYNNTNVTVVINGGVVKSAGYFAIDMVGYYDFAPALVNSVTVNGGVIDGGIYARVQANTKLDLAINGGTIKSDFSYAVYFRVYYTGCEYSASITGGNFSTAEGTANVGVRLCTGAELAGFITGGSFTTNVNEFCADGYRLIDKADGSYGVTQSSSTPEIIDGYWWIGGVNTGKPASPSVEMVECAEHGVICWYVNGTCTGIQAIGTDGTLPEVAIIDGYWYIDNKDGKGLLPTGIKAEGAEGITIVKIEKNAEASDALATTYVITFSNGQTWSFVVTNGLPGAEGPQGPQGPEGPKGQTGNQGLPGADANDNNKTVIILIAISAVCIIFSLAVILYRGIDRRSWWCTR